MELFSPVQRQTIPWNDKFIGKFSFRSIFKREKKMGFFILFSWNHADGKNRVECLSCRDENETCAFANAQFSPGKGSYYILECNGPSIPYSTLHNRTHRLTLINDNENFRKWTENRLMPYVDYFSVPFDKKSSGQWRQRKSFRFIEILFRKRNDHFSPELQSEHHHRLVSGDRFNVETKIFLQSNSNANFFL